jgi:hypothetical protein
MGAKNMFILLELMFWQGWGQLCEMHLDQYSF